ncbi:MAG TPA: hypothetical protein VGE59_00565 [Patescibacteria group bacterium]
MKTKYLFPILGLAALGVVSLGAMHTLAHDTAASDGKTLVQRLSEKFNLKESDVEQVFTEHKSQVQATMEKRIDDKLTQAVTNKKITEEQKQKIIAKQKELQTQMEATKETLKNMTPQERQAEMKKQRDALEQWAKDNGIDTQYLRGLGFKGVHRGGMRGGHRPF